MMSWGALGTAVDQAVDSGLDDLIEARRIPSISATGVGLRESAGYLATLLSSDGWTAEIAEIGRDSIVFAEIGPTDGPALIFDGPHDVQPAAPDSDSVIPPFEPAARDGRIGRLGSADNKSQFFYRIFGARALTHALGGPPLRLKLVLDGQEEMGDPEIPEFIELFRPRPAGAELCLTTGGPTLIDERPEVGFGVRSAAEMKRVQ